MIKKNVLRHESTTCLKIKTLKDLEFKKENEL